MKEEMIEAKNCELFWKIEINYFVINEIMSVTDYIILDLDERQRVIDTGILTWCEETQIVKKDILNLMDLRYSLKARLEEFKLTKIEYKKRLSSEELKKRFMFRLEGVIYYKKKLYVSEGDKKIMFSCGECESSCEGEECESWWKDID